MLALLVPGVAMGGGQAAAPSTASPSKQQQGAGV